MTHTTNSDASERERNEAIEQLEAGRCSKWSHQKDVAAMLRADAEQLRDADAVAKEYIRFNESLREQLAARSAEVEALRQLIRNWTGCSPEDLQAAERDYLQENSRDAG